MVSCALNPEGLQQYISSIGLSLFKITHKADNNTSGLSPIRIVIEVWCKIQSLIFNKGVVVIIDINGFFITAINNFDVSYFIHMIFAYMSKHLKIS